MAKSNPVFYGATGSKWYSWVKSVKKFNNNRQSGGQNRSTGRATPSTNQASSSKVTVNKMVDPKYEKMKSNFP